MKDVIRVLLIDDDEDDFVITRDLLSEIKEIQYELDWDRCLSSKLSPKLNLFFCSNFL